MVISSRHAKASSLIEVRNLVKVYRTPAGDFTAVKGIDVEVKAGEFIGIIGKSGSGKSTFINMLTGIDRPTSGEVVIGGAPVHTFNESQMAAWRGKNLGIVFQFFQLLPTLTLFENILLPMELNKQYAPRERRERAMHLLERVEMAQQANKLPSAVSGGQQQRVAIARALANDPPLIVADEPTGNLDSKTAEKIFRLFEELAASGKTILMVTHDSDLARRVNRTIVISDGEIVNEYLVRALSALTQDQLVEVARRVKPQVYARNASIIKQGEVGDKFYVLLDGKVDVLIEQPGGTEILVNQLEAGQYFGEMALMGNGIRTATVKASSDHDAKVAALDSRAFNDLVSDSRVLREELSGLIEQRTTANEVRSLSEIKQDDLLSMVKGAQAITFKAGTEIIRQGALGDSFFIIEDGKVDVVIRDAAGSESRVNQLRRGQYFGEMALLGNRRRNASVRASQDGPVRVIELGEEEFQQLINSSDEINQKVQKEARQRKKDLERVRKGTRRK
ncbi:MAG TPA: cyclic nucleotide-binding domain-containing protein [Anaerolineales bacterium]|nr:cyclic nucleotide-binding domain-containing protein [Anaerolineales bacterium]